MDFAFSEEQEALRDLATQIFADHTGHARLQELEKSGEWYDRALWSELAKTNLTALCLPEQVGGGGCGIIETCLVLAEQGRHLAPVPLLPTLLLGGLPLADFGTTEQRERWLRPVAEGEGVLTAALHEEGSALPALPRTRARHDGTGWHLDGLKVCIPAAHLADAILVPARTSNTECRVFIIEPSAEGARLERQITTNREPQGRFALEDVRVSDDALLGDAKSAARLFERASIGLCALQLGIAEEALRRTAVYTTDRRQFGSPIGSFQAVQVRAADAFIDTEALRGTLWQAAWRLSEGLPAAREVGAARWWACVAGHRVTHAAQHLHGGIGSDVDYPIHRFMLWAKQVEATLGGETQEGARLGRIVVDSPRKEG
ncbi:MAG: acyl-CoA dehydrogenase family protein [Myxococcota bacterium]|jgi:alkylation response protein AidB-like acyl-CoA dehydrogenase|nr:acyl-CoA dehydrogenase [Deltaproteobacteria bacterium]MCP4238950.1 acyl-CoA/acyl-ACP dehydrogenase [bacterium]MDP6074106.1 acyl-CoA dehydrogenase family protein [Myxococcota bacterium]MDP6243147.1 acyl-CoA dehydrogenase family protein [Myxococcota bacterium]MDP7074047.1 acyl-CoA dehydrogenase family protein [Myxococcota bacterium]